ncbi:hypothetical protein [Breoghania sp.]|uniref:hypothetical protein n=1 Tax=Breoghania sp. TaxID=2065378 RepID=UPI002AA8E7BE|nr:hypothetical protein [Breoghania sp.]
MTFDRIIAVLALAIGLTGGVPTVLDWLDKRTSFELVSSVPFIYSRGDHGFQVNIPAIVINSSEVDLTIIAIEYSISDRRGSAIDYNVLSFGKFGYSEGNRLPVRLGPADNISVNIPVRYYSTKFDGPKESSEIDDSDDVRVLFREEKFPDSDGMIEFARSKCDRAIMNTELSRCIRIKAVLSNERVAEVGELAVTFISDEKAGKP